MVQQPNLLVVFILLIKTTGKFGWCTYHKLISDSKLWIIPIFLFIGILPHMLNIPRKDIGPNTLTMGYPKNTDYIAAHVDKITKKSVKIWHELHDENKTAKGDST